MDEREAIDSLGDPSISRRLAGARFLAVHSSAHHLDALKVALAQESVAYIRSALEKAVARVEGLSSPPTTALQRSNYEEDLYAKALLDVTSEVLHELEPLVGVLRLRLLSEWEHFEGSKTAKALAKLELALESVRELNSVSRVPKFSTTAVADVLTEVADEFKNQGKAVSLEGPQLLVKSSARLLEVIVRNGLRNAFEASVQNSPSPVLTWGAMGDDYFISVFDSGIGPPRGVGNRFELGRSTKNGHLGVGLAIAQRAARTLNGSLTLRGREEGGAVLEFRARKKIQ